MFKFPLKPLIALLLGIALHTDVSATGIQFFQGSWVEAQHLAQKQHKGLFITAYSDWCYACHKIENIASQESAIADYYNQYFVSYKIDIESPEGAILAAEYGIKALPDCLFLDADGNVLQRNKGDMDKWALLNLGMQASENLPKRATSSNKIDSDKKTLQQTTKEVQNVHEKNIWASVSQAIANKDVELLRKIETIALKLPNGEEQQKAILKAYYSGTGDIKRLSLIERQEKTRDVCIKDPLFWHKKASDLASQSKAKGHLKQALQWVEFSLSLEKKFDAQETHAFILYKLGKYKKAAKSAEIALQLASIADKPCHGAYNLLQMLRK